MGSIISSKYILTAAHCADGVSHHEVVIGAHEIRDPANKIIDAYSPTVHPEWDCRVRTISGSQLAPPKTGTMIQMTQKERPQMDVVGNVSGKTCIIVEDMLTEAEAFCISASYLKQAGANRIIVMVTHGIFVDNSIELIEQSEIDEVIVTNSVNFNAHGSSKIRMVDISGLLAEAIRRTHHGESMSFMFKNVPIED